MHFRSVFQSKGATEKSPGIPRWMVVLMAAKIALSLTPGSGRRALPINGALYSSGELGTWLLKLAEIPTIIPQKDGEFIKSHVSVEIYRVPVLEGLVFACALPKNQSF